MGPFSNIIFHQGGPLLVYQKQAVGGAVVGGLIGYGTQVYANLQSGVDLGTALTTDISAEPIISGALLGGALAAGGAYVAAALGVGGTGAAATGGAATVAGGAVQAAGADGDPTNEVSTFGEFLYQFSGRSGGFKSGLNPGETEMALARAADFSSPTQAFETIIGRSPNPSEMYRVTNVGTVWGHRFYPVYNSLQDGNPFGHVSLYGADKWDPKLFEKIFNPILFGPPQPLIPQ